MIEEDKTMTEHWLDIEGRAYTLGRLLTKYIAPAQGDETKADDVLRECDAIIDSCAMLMEKILQFDSLRTGRVMDYVI
jgi:hypothetical protein